MLLKIVVFPLFFFFLLLLLLPIVSCTPVPAPAPTSPNESTTEFIRSRCRTTRYPDLCFTSLSRYAAAVGDSPVQLAYVATNVALARVRTLRVQIVYARRRATGPEAAALRDCVEALGDAADHVRWTVKELSGLESEEQASKVAWRLSNARTWMSAALSSEDTCSNGFEDVGGSGDGVEAEVSRWVGNVMQYTSNALALINSLGDGRR